MKKFKEQFSYDPEENSRANRTHIGSEPEQDLTQQHYKDDTDLNVIVKRFGAAPVAKPQPPGYYTVDHLQDYQSALNGIQEGQRAFNTVPAELRARFNNDPGQFIAYMRDDKNHDEARKLGIIPAKPKERPPTPVMVVNPTVPPTPSA